MKQSILGLWIVVGALCVFGTSQALACTASPCTGDCDYDDIVEDGEPVRTAMVAVGTEPYSLCPRSDGDGDCEVEVTDVIAATINYIDSVCTAAPGSTTDTAELEIVSFSGCRGDTTGVIYVQVNHGTGQPTAIQVTLGWPSGVAENVHCYVNINGYIGVHGAGGGGDAGPHIVIADYNGLDVIPDGAQAIACDFDIKSDAPIGTHTLSIDAGLASDAEARAQDTTLTNGTIEVGCADCGCPCAP